MNITASLVYLFLVLFAVLSAVFLYKWKVITRKYGAERFRSEFFLDALAKNIEDLLLLKLVTELRHLLYKLSSGDFEELARASEQDFEAVFAKLSQRGKENESGE
jgi:hypothetical protein